MIVSDNNSGVHPKIMDKLFQANTGHVSSYGSDDFTAEAIAKIQSLFTGEPGVYFVLNGTAANVLGLSSALRPFEGCICSDRAHINVDECGAFERFTGSKIIPIAHYDGKIRVKEVEACLHAIDNEHESQPKVISISQPTELGTAYSPSEIKELSDLAHAHDMYLHVDGSRLSNAAVGTGKSFKEMIKDTEVDILSFGGTKNGMMYGEAIVVFNKSLDKSMKFIRKQGMHLNSKLRFVSAQFLAYLENDLWRDNATNANSLAQLICRKVVEIPGLSIAYEVQANMVFIRMPELWAKKVSDKYDVEVINGTDVRVVASFDSKVSDIEEFISDFKALLA